MTSADAAVDGGGGTGADTHALLVVCIPLANVVAVCALARAKTAGQAIVGVISCFVCGPAHSTTREQHDIRMQAEGLHRKTGTSVSHSS